MRRTNRNQQAPTGTERTAKLVFEIHGLAVDLILTAKPSNLPVPRLPCDGTSAGACNGGDLDGVAGTKTPYGTYSTTEAMVAGLSAQQTTSLRRSTEYDSQLYRLARELAATPAPVVASN